jgi:hypothetical protein
MKPDLAIGKGQQALGDIIEKMKLFKAHCMCLWNYYNETSLYYYYANWKIKGTTLVT